MQREALLTNAVMAFAQLLNERKKLSFITHGSFGCGATALAAEEFAHHILTHLN
jgi:predicted nucleotide-binding protein (sugar kinase/HSP70/actin superfamily)